MTYREYTFLCGILGGVPSPDEEYRSYREVEVENVKIYSRGRYDVPGSYFITSNNKLYRADLGLLSNTLRIEESHIKEEDLINSGQTKLDLVRTLELQKKVSAQYD